MKMFFTPRIKRAVIMVSGTIITSMHRRSRYLAGIIRGSTSEKTPIFSGGYVRQ